MAIKVVKISALYGKDLYASKSNINLRRSPGLNAEVLRKIPSGDRIGNVSTYAEGRDANGNKDGSIWLQLKEAYGNPSGFGAWVKYMPDAFDWKSLKEQGAQTVEEEEKEKEEKDKTIADKLMDAGKWLLIGWVAVEALKTSGTKNR